MPRGRRLESQLTSGDLSRLAIVLGRLGTGANSGVRGHASISATRETVQTVRVRACGLRRPVPRQRLPTMSSLVVNIDVSHSTHERGVAQELGRELRRKVMSRVGNLLSEKVPTRGLVCCNLRCGFVARCIVNGAACSRVFENLRVTVRRFTGHRVA